MNISYVVHDTVCRTQLTYRPTEIKYSHKNFTHNSKKRTEPKLDIHFDFFSQWILKSFSIAILLQD